LPSKPAAASRPVNSRPAARSTLSFAAMVRMVHRHAHQIGIDLDGAEAAIAAITRDHRGGGAGGADSLAQPARRAGPSSPLRAE